MKRFWVMVCVGLLLLTPVLAKAETPRVVTSIRPLHSLVSAVMQGVGEPELLVKGVSSPHTHTLHPADMSAVQRADVLLFISPKFETFMAKPASQVKADEASKQVQIEVASLKGLKRFDARNEELEEHDEHGHEGHNHGPEDMHYWLDVSNSILVVQKVSETLSRLDKKSAKTYQANAARYIEELKQLDAEITAATKGFKQQNFIVFHDAYQYFEKRYGLQPAAALTIEPGRGTSAKHVSYIRKLAKEKGVACLFKEPQFDPKTVASIAKDVSVPVLELDPLGSALPPGEKLYPQLMRDIAMGFNKCFQPPQD
jgi:zinc transport system substrate-binding protein